MVSRIGLRTLGLASATLIAVGHREPRDTTLQCWYVMGRSVLTCPSDDTVGRGKDDYQVVSDVPKHDYWLSLSVGNYHGPRDFSF